MKVIFLDIDGVLNTYQTYIEIFKEEEATGKHRIEIDLNRVFLLKELVDATDAKIVLCSSWRVGAKMVQKKIIPLNKQMTSLINIFAEYGLTIYDMTPVMEGQREHEIRAWLNENDVESFVILDDDPYPLQGFLHKELIKTSTVLDHEMMKDMKMATGLCKHHIVKAKRILNQTKQKKLGRKEKNEY